MTTYKPLTTWVMATALSLTCGLLLAGCDRLADTGRRIDHMVGASDDKHAAPTDRPATTVNINVMPAESSAPAAPTGTAEALVGAWSVDNDLCGGEDNFVFDANGDWSGGPYLSGRWQLSGDQLTIHVNALTRDMMDQPLPPNERVAASRIATPLEWNGPDQIRVQLGSPNGPSTMNRCRIAGTADAVRPVARVADAAPVRAARLAAPRATPARPGDGYYAVFASIPAGHNVADESSAMMNRLSACGINTHIDQSDLYPGWTPGFTVVMAGPSAQREQANATVRRAAHCGITGYLKLAGPPPT